MRTCDPKVEIADGTYELAKNHAKLAGRTQQITISIIERRFKLRPGQLRNYRANYYSR
jgi:hypothetical protein